MSEKRLRTMLFEILMNSYLKIPSYQVYHVYYQCKKTIKHANNIESMRIKYKQVQEQLEHSKSMHQEIQHHPI